MSWIGHNPPMQIVGMRVFCLRAVVLAMLGTLALAGSAYAAGRADVVPPSETLEAPSGEEAEGGAGQGAEQEQEATGTGGEEAPEGGGAGSGEEHQEAPPPAEEHQETTPVIEEHQESTPAVTLVDPETTPAVEQSSEEAATAAHTGQAGEEGSRSSINADQVVSQTLLAHTDSTQESPPALLGAATSPPAAGGPEAQAAASPAIIAVGARAAMTAVQRAGAMSCELAALGGSTTDNCTVGWLGAKRFLTSPGSFTRADGSLAAAAAGLSGGVAVTVALPLETHPSVPLPDRPRAALRVPPAAAAGVA